MRDVDGNEIILVNPRFVNEVLNADQQLDYKVNYLFVEKYNGKVKWYRSYGVNGYGQETNKFNSFVLDGKIYWWNEFQRFKKIALRLYSDYPEIVEKLESQKKIKIYPYSEEKLLDFLIEYDQYIKD